MKPELVVLAKARITGIIAGIIGVIYLTLFILWTWITQVFYLKGDYCITNQTYNVYLLHNKMVEIDKKTSIV